MYRGDREISEETSDEAERPLTITSFDNLNKMFKPIFNWAKIDGVIYF